ncbi:tRNA (adenosine(37)-N6)-threonylcarbamoyltransferase complex transferase subunit TsaD [Campylobacter canadensis]|uniref:tRNA (adenosine(37)-N6)-threonylcarbamoyltransferase complex transferase subunit TsaD n=1 Tax=Campylobacter canadensis TaxID=449520 RepID=UPI001555F76F|nr:tRNA (adenosine(37)-N6)-threonylcarbamoyltransferase complex transferase subunit TsaD [Campylobacter canadensis]
MILAIESSCDDSSIAIIDTKDLKEVFYEKISQNEHSAFGGVVPELASRLHTIALPNILKQTKQYFPNLKAIAVTNEPGLSVSLQSGVAMAKALALSLKLPLITVNHLVGHICSLFLNEDIQNNFLCLLVSGGHTQILKINKNYEIQILAKTNDDSFGESFDKVAKMLDLSYPGGPIVEELAKKGKNICNFTTPLKDKTRLEYSFSGLKNQVRLALNDFSKNDICASFQATAINHICDKIELFMKDSECKMLGIVGGASANLALRKEIELLCNKYNFSLKLAPLKYCSDNALMIARAAVLKYKRAEFANLNTELISPVPTDFRRI